MLIQLKSWSAKAASHHPAFTGNCPTISHTCQPYLSRKWVLLFVLVVSEQNESTW